MGIRRLTEADASAHLALRIEALERKPNAFVRSLEDEQAHIFGNGWAYALLACRHCHINFV